MNDRRKFGEVTNMWKLNHTLLIASESNEKLQGKLENNFEVNENKNTIYQNLWDVAKVMIRGKYISVNA